MSEKETICMEINYFANCCGYFHNAYLTDGVTYNNGYNCWHQQQAEQETDLDTGKVIGACYAWSCPLGYPPDTTDLVKFGIITKEEAERDFDKDESDTDYIIIDDTKTLQMLKDKGGFKCQ